MYENSLETFGAHDVYGVEDVFVSVSLGQSVLMTPQSSSLAALAHFSARAEHQSQALKGGRTHTCTSISQPLPLARIALQQNVLMHSQSQNAETLGERRRNGREWYTAL